MLGLRQRLRARNSLFDLIREYHIDREELPADLLERLEEEVDELPPLPTSPASPPAPDHHQLPPTVISDSDEDRTPPAMAPVGIDPLSSTTDS